HRESPQDKPPASSEEFLFEIESQEPMAPREVPARPAAAVRPTPPPARPAVSLPMPKRAPQKPAQQIELWNILVSYFTGGNVVVRAGVVVLFFGVAFLLKYS